LEIEYSSSYPTTGFQISCMSIGVPLKDQSL
jgi:hypothetical protein